MGGGKVVVGNNCFIGYQSLILKDTQIGDNVIIGARAVVKGIIPSNTVWAGCPAKQICTTEDLYKKLSLRRIQEAFFRRDIVRETKKREPTIGEMGLFCCLFLERNELNYSKYVKNIEFNGIKSSPHLKEYFFSSSPMFSSFEEFLSA